MARTRAPRAAAQQKKKGLKQKQRQEQHVNVRVGGGGGGGGGEYQRPQVVQVQDRYEPIGGSYAPRSNNELVAASVMAEREGMNLRRALADTQFSRQLAVTGVQAAIALAPSALAYLPVVMKGVASLGRMWSGFKEPAGPLPVQRAAGTAAGRAALDRSRLGSAGPTLARSASLPTEITGVSAPSRSDASMNVYLNTVAGGLGETPVQPTGDRLRGPNWGPLGQRTSVQKP